MADYGVWVQLDVAAGTPGARPITIFKNQKQAILACSNELLLALWNYADAAEKIRLAVFSRDKYTCTHCGAAVTWNGPSNKGELHERRWRGRGGLMSVENSTTLCHDCHEHDKVAGHGKRAVQWS